MKDKVEKYLNALIPTPKNIKREDGYREIPLKIFAECEDLLCVTEAFCESIKKLYDKDVLIEEGGVLLRYDDSLAEGAYTVDTREDIILSASSKEGICYAIATLLQMAAPSDGSLWVARLYIQDAPDKPYRSLMVDLAREWHPASTIFKYIDVCFMLKIRYLQLHFMDDQAYTLPSKVLPELTKYNRHYTFEDIERFNAYAKARGVIIIPEFEVPGHATMLLKTYPEIFAIHPTENDSDVPELVTETGILITTDNIICVGSEITNNAVSDLLAEMCEMFPDTPYIHIGGDEANIRVWNNCSECIRYMKENGLKDAYELYSEFVGRVARKVFEFGKTPIVWEGFPNRGVQYIPKETIVIAWESYYQIAPELLANGFHIINGSWQPLYIVPSYKTRWGVNEIYDWNVYNWQHFWSESKAYANPINVEPTDMVLGAQISAWESTHEEDIGKILESLSTLSERTWNLERLYTTDEFIKRMNVTLHHIARLIQDR